MSRIILVVKNDCKNCDYIVKQLNKTDYREQVEIVDYNDLDEKLRKKLNSLPAVIVLKKNKKKIEYLTGSLIGLIKLVMIIEKENKKTTKK